MGHMGRGNAMVEEQLTWQSTSGNADAHRGRYQEEASRSVPGETSMNEKLETWEQEGGMGAKLRALGESVSTE